MIYNAQPQQWPLNDATLSEHYVKLQNSSLKLFQYVICTKTFITTRDIHIIP